MDAKKYRAICESERYRTMGKIEKMPTDQRDDATKLFCTLQNTINQFVQSEDREIHYAIAPTVLRLLAAEMDTIAQRMQKEMQ